MVGCCRVGSATPIGTASNRDTPRGRTVRLHQPRLIAHLNLTGHLTPGSWFTSDKRRPSWTSIATSTDRRARVIEALERSEGLRPPTSTPSATPVSLSIRAIAAFMERSSLATQSRWEWANGYYDSSLGCEVREDCFQALPLVARHRESNNEPVILNVKEYRYWFLLNQSIDDSSPVLAIDQASGIAWDLEHSYDLMGMYKQRNRSLDRLVSDVFPPAF